MAEFKVLEASPKVVDTLVKANNVLNTIELNDRTNFKKISNDTIFSNSSNDLIPAKVVSGNSISGYSCRIYRNGLDEPYTDTGTVYLPNGSSTLNVLPEGTILFVRRLALPIFGGN